MTDFDYEKDKLKDILEKYKEVIDDYEFMIKRLPEVHRNQPLLMESLLKMYGNKLRLMKEGLNKPYFARLDFKSDDERELDQCYLGKVGVTDFDNKTVTVDWRAPIASMYYDSNIGRASYETPMGTINGELLVKRQIDIEKGELERIQDVDTVSNDDILKPYLGVTADNRLKNIVSTIQSEQNEIIRDQLSNNLIVQGVAGSGKTTVALHRIAYLVYNYQQKIKPEQYMVIGPNSFFLDYISSVLPDLDASTVEQTTFDSLIQEYIDEKLQINSAELQLIQSLKKGANLSICKYKNSLRYKELLDKFMIDFDSKVVPPKDLEVKEIPILPQSVIQKVYDEVGKNSYSTIEARIERTILLLSAYIENSMELKEKINLKTIEASPAARDFVKKELRNGFKQSLRQHLSKQLKRNITSVYSDFIKNVVGYANNEDTKLVSELKKQTESNIKSKAYDFDDLAALAYLKLNINGSREYSKYRHVVIDEAQDYGDFNFYVLENMMKNSSFSIYGDIAQSIYSYRSIDNWNSVVEVFNKKIEIKNLLKSYRTTIEIMDQANNITSHIGLPAATPVIRHGSDVGYDPLDGDLGDKVSNYVLSYIKQGRKSIAIICKTAEEAVNVHQKLGQKDMNAECIIDSKNNYSGGLCVTTAYLSKGLEFDAVLIANASEEVYLSENSNDMKLLYVAMTRALHNLDIIYDGELTKPLNDRNKKKELQQYKKIMSV